MTENKRNIVVIGSFAVAAVILALRLPKSVRVSEIPMQLFIDGVHGNDLNPCTQATPCKTLQRAMDKVPEKLKQQVVINVAPDPNGYVGWNTRSVKRFENLTINTPSGRIQIEDTVFEDSGITIYEPRK